MIWILLLACADYCYDKTGYADDDLDACVEAICDCNFDAPGICGTIDDCYEAFGYTDYNVFAEDYCPEVVCASGNTSDPDGNDGGGGGGGNSEQCPEALVGTWEGTYPYALYEGSTPDTSNCYGAGPFTFTYSCAGIDARGRSLCTLVGSGAIAYAYDTTVTDLSDLMADGDLVVESTYTDAGAVNGDVYLGRAQWESGSTYTTMDGALAGATITADIQGVPSCAGWGFPGLDAVPFNRTSGTPTTEATATWDGDVVACAESDGGTSASTVEWMIAKWVQSRGTTREARRAAWHQMFVTGVVQTRFAEATLVVERASDPTFWPLVEYTGDVVLVHLTDETAAAVDGVIADYEAGQLTRGAALGRAYHALMQGTGTPG